MTNVLVTGATGRVGKHLVNALLDRGEKVRVLVRKKLVEKEEVEVVCGDLLDVESLKKAVRGIEVTYHLASVVDYFVSKKTMFNINVVGTKNLLQTSQGQRFIYLSSTAAMGKKLKEIPATEKTMCIPSNYYGQTKLEAEALVRKAGGIVIRSADIMGPGFEEGYNYVLSRIAEERIVIPGNGKNFIQWVHIKDLVQALLLAKEKGKLGEVYIIAGKEVRTLNECFALMAKHLGVVPPKKHVPKILALTAAHYKSLRKRHNKEKPIPMKEFIEKMTANRYFDISKARTKLGFEPVVTYQEVAKEMAMEYRKIVK